MRWLQLLFVCSFCRWRRCSLNGGKVTTYAAEARAPYTLDAGDVMKVSVYGDDSLSRTYKVDEAGTIAVPLVGPVPVRGLTTHGACGGDCRRARQRLHAQPERHRRDRHLPALLHPGRGHAPAASSPTCPA